MRTRAITREVNYCVLSNLIGLQFFCSGDNLKCYASPDLLSALSMFEGVDVPDYSPLDFELRSRLVSRARLLTLKKRSGIFKQVFVGIRWSVGEANQIAGLPLIGKVTISQNDSSWITCQLSPVGDKGSSRNLGRI